MYPCGAPYVCVLYWLLVYLFAALVQHALNLSRETEMNDANWWEKSLKTNYVNIIATPYGSV